MTQGKEAGRVILFDCEQLHSTYNGEMGTHCTRFLFWHSIQKCFFENRSAYIWTERQDFFFFFFPPLLRFADIYSLLLNWTWVSCYILSTRTDELWMCPLQLLKTRELFQMGNYNFLHPRGPFDELAGSTHFKEDVLLTAELAWQNGCKAPIKELQRAMILYYTASGVILPDRRTGPSIGEELACFVGILSKSVSIVKRQDQWADKHTCQPALWKWKQVGANTLYDTPAMCSIVFYGFLWWVQYNITVLTRI